MLCVYLHQSFDHFSGKLPQKERKWLKSTSEKMKRMNKVQVMSKWDPQPSPPSAATGYHRYRSRPTNIYHTKLV